MSALAQVLRSKQPAPSLRLLRRNKKDVRGSSVRGTLTMVGVACVLGGSIIFAVLLEQVVLAQSAFELGTLRQDMAAAESLHEELLLESAKLDNAARIERYARQSLGMVEPAPGTVQYVVADVRTGTSLAQTTVQRGSSGRKATSSVVGPASAVGAGYGASP
ncbi:MAG TPA: cell division protein FtsL [Actinomycetota bacterium]|nr:cell division protein FtsL [Actinomycetota bacterium]